MRIFPWLLPAWLGRHVSGGLRQDGSPERLQSAERNANHIFNALHSSMRQWGSSLNHNGFSFYLATIPQDTRLYHGRVTTEPKAPPVEGVDWLAFEPEHSMFFATPVWQRQIQPREVFRGQGHDPADQPGGSPPFVRGALYTFKTRRDLRLLYIDGTSAGKTDMGTLDSQDYVLRNMTSSPNWFDDRERAHALCDIVRDEWGSSLDGFIRMEAGFEAILCSIERVLEPIYVTEPFSVPTADIAPNQFIFNWVRAVAARYQGIGGNRVTVDYDSFVTGYAFPIDAGPSGLPRLANASTKVRAQLRHEVTEMVLRGPSRRTSGARNWQQVTDLIVDHYAMPLKRLLSTSIAPSAAHLIRELEYLLLPFLDKEHRDPATELDRCRRHFLPELVSADSVDAASIAAIATAHVSHKICAVAVESLYDLYRSMLDPREEERVRLATVARVGDLVSYLGWTVWKECPRCGYDEVCMVAMWPFGDVEDHEHPSCKNATRVEGLGRYWTT